MAYLNLDLDYFDHPKTKRLVGVLGRGSDGLPIRLWCYCGKYHAENGNLIGYSPTDLESLIGWWGQPGKAVEALIQFKFLEKTDSGFQVHDWLSINGHIQALKERGQAAAKARWAKADAQAMLMHSLSNAVSNALVLPSSDQDQDQEKKEKKKKEDSLPRFQPPSLPEVSAYCQERGNAIDAEAFVEFYSSNGWKVGKNKMVSWRSAMVTWEKRNGSKNGISGGNRWKSKSERLDDDARAIISEHRGAQGGNQTPTQPRFSLSQSRAAGT